MDAGQEDAHAQRTHCGTVRDEFVERPRATQKKKKKRGKRGKEEIQTLKKGER